jgi:choline dehydrogenase-like flavoprotein
VRVSTAIGYLTEARSRPNLTIQAQTVVDKIVVESQTAVGVIVVRDGVSEELRGQRISLAAGAIGTPPILIRSGIGPADQLQQLGIDPVAVLEGVGRNLSDHPGVAYRWCPSPASAA